MDIFRRPDEGKSDIVHSFFENKGKVSQIFLGKDREIDRRIREYDSLAILDPAIGKRGCLDRNACPAGCSPWTWRAWR